MDLSTLQKLQNIYKSGSNISQFLRKQEKTKHNSPEIIQISYDFQAGSYIDYAKKNVKYMKRWSQAIVNEIKLLNIKGQQTLLEAGVGEATTFCHVVSGLGKNVSKAYGFDISWSRLAYGRKYLKAHSQTKNTTLFMADLFSIPLSDNAIDVVYTAHSIEPNGGKEKEILKELYRVSSKYVVLLEPDYSFANKVGRQRMIQHGFITRLPQAAKELGYEVIMHRPFEVHSNPLNPTGLLIIKKKSHKSGNTFMCPISHEKLMLVRDAYFSPKGLLAYPIIGGIPCLLPQNAIVATALGTNLRSLHD